MNILFAIALLWVMFLTTSTAPLLGIHEVTTYSYIFMVVYMICVMVKYRRVFWKKGSFGVGLLVLAVFGIILKFAMGQDYFKSYLCFMILPILMSMSFENNTQSRKRLMEKFVLLFLFVECGVAIYERMAEVSLFYQYTEEDLKMIKYAETWEFRSNALLDHPLLNAHVVTIITAFILTSKKGLLLKFFCFLLSYITLFCFNARGATIVFSIVFIPYMYYLIRHNAKRKYRDWLSLFAVAIVVYMLYTVFNTDLGGRLANADELMDGSAMTRLEVFNFASLISSDVLIWGSPNAYKSLMRDLGAGGVENGIVVLVINYGLLLATLMIIMLFRFQLGRMKGYYSKGKTVIVFLVFYIIGTMNPNLATPTVWVWWVICYYAFRDDHNWKCRQAIYILQDKGNNKQVAHI